MDLKVGVPAGADVGVSVGEGVTVTVAGGVPVGDGGANRETGAQAANRKENSKIVRRNFDTATSKQKHEQNHLYSRLRLEPFEFAQVGDAIGQCGDLLHQSQAVLLQGFVIGHHEYFIKELVDGRDEFLDSLQESIHIVKC